MTDRELAFKAMKSNTDPAFEDATIYGVSLRSMTPEERLIALGWALTQMKNLEQRL